MLTQTEIPKPKSKVQNKVMQTEMGLSGEFDIT